MLHHPQVDDHLPLHRDPGEHAGRDHQLEPDEFGKLRRVPADAAAPVTLAPCGAYAGAWRGYDPRTRNIGAYSER